MKRPSADVRLPPSPENRDLTCIVQIVVSSWTKASRGAPAAGLRNAVPLSFSLPTGYTVGQVLLHEVSCDEGLNFSARIAPRLRAVSAGQLAAHRLSVCCRKEDVEIAFSGAPLAPATGRPSDQVVLVPGQWLRIVTNRRIAVEYTWAYRRFVYNIACCVPEDFDSLLSRCAATVLLDRETRLW